MPGNCLEWSTSWYAISKWWWTWSAVASGNLFLIQIDQHSWKRSWWYLVWLGTVDQSSQLYKWTCAHSCVSWASHLFLQCKKHYILYIGFSASDWRICSKGGNGIEFLHFISISVLPVLRYFRFPCCLFCVFTGFSFLCVHLHFCLFMSMDLSYLKLFKHHWFILSPVQSHGTFLSICFNLKILINSLILRLPITMLILVFIDPFSPKLFSPWGERDFQLEYFWLICLHIFHALSLLCMIMLVFHYLTPSHNAILLSSLKTLNCFSVIHLRKLSNLCVKFPLA